ncbi:MAG TPA: 2-amino-4-hydroxy-6-hydroxymethyldihydropteridine diphosphokinase [Spirochaetota bacterium]|nr:2-amino-4-hydroxy-6-hydroxymethyldihydropteridine diphosphokinase [Spirochaetota bacterium]HPV42137.1 2-amino-4-hydroxy-6-hydroxymethyldihydropteridine diphosphokinase [Spirochaetota bacterium]
MAIVYIGLGSNLGDREKNLKDAINALVSHPSIKLLKQSSILETEPVDYLDQPIFLNMIIVVETDLAPRELLETTGKTELELGRQKTIPKGPRTIDLDILLYDDIILNTGDLIIPHPEIKNRPFIIKHLVELDPELKDPITIVPYRNLI